MTIDKAKLRAAAEAAGPKDYFAPRPYEEDRHYDDQELKRLEFMAEADPATVLALLAEIEQLREAHEQVCANYNRVSFASEERGKQIDQLKAENEVLRKDAENWQTVRRAMDQLKSDEQGAAIWSACSLILISLVSDLNCARSVVTEEGVTKDGAEIGDWRVTVERLAMAKEAGHD